MVKTHATGSWQPLYRALLRSSYAAVRFSRPAAKNTRRYLRDEFAHAVRNAAQESKTGRSDAATWQGMGRQTHHTLALHLSSSLLPSGARQVAHRRAGASEAGIVETQVTSASKSVEASESQDGVKSKANKGARLAHRVVSNLASLTYHHLSPHTQMQTHKRLGDRESHRKPKRLSSLARVLGQVDASAATDTDGSASASAPASSGFGELEDALAGAGSDGMVNETHLRIDFLLPSIKPMRGPVSSRLKVWDGQGADKIDSDGQLRQMEADLRTIERLLSEHKPDPTPKPTARTRGGVKKDAMAKQMAELRHEAEQLKKRIKTMARELAKAEQKVQLEDIPIGVLADVVAAAQDAEGLLLGKQRWMTRKQRGFLPP